LRPEFGVVISPLIALMKDQVDALWQAGVRGAAPNSGFRPPKLAEMCSISSTSHPNVW
jgi:ATP-dependent DNA helicase RecQ